MMTSNFKRILIATAGASALSLALGINPAAAVPPAFTIDPNATGLGTSGYTPQVETDINGTSDALIQQIGANTQKETGWLQISSFTNNGAGSTFFQTGLFGSYTSAPPAPANTYGLYITFSGTVQGLTSFGPGQTGTVGPGGYTFTLLADVGPSDTFNSGSTSATGGAVPTVTGGIANDVVIAVGASISGTTGQAPTTGAPFFDVLASFIICDGTAGEGKQGSTTVSGGLAASCGTFNGLNYFVNPVPFYQFDFNTSVSGSAQNFGTPFGNGIIGGNITLNGVVADINFIPSVPEPGTLAMFGFGLVGLGWFTRRRQKTA